MIEHTMEKIFTSARNGEDKALHTLSAMFFKGLEATHDEEPLLDWFCRAAQLERKEALFRLGRYSLDRSDYEQAEKMLLQAVEQGSDNARCSLGLLYCSDDWAGHDEEKGLRWYREAAESGNVEAMTALGLSGREDAGKWLAKAAEMGSEVAKRMEKEMSANVQ